MPKKDWASFLSPTTRNEAFFLSFIDPIPYSQAQEIQKQLLTLRAEEKIPDTFIALEHTPVITQGRGLQKEVRENLNLKHSQRNLILTKALPDHIEFCETERGGDLTYHAPGQLVLYPIIKLDNRHAFSTHQDVPKYIRTLEHLIIKVLSNLGLKSESKKGTAGVWVDEKKIASVGIAVQNFITYHGIAINCVNSLEGFQVFSPCGLNSSVMTNLIELKPEIENDFDHTPWREFIERLVFDTITEMLGTEFLLTRKFSATE